VKLVKNVFVSVLTLFLLTSFLFFFMRPGSEAAQRRAIDRSLELNSQAADLMAGGQYEAALVHLQESLGLNPLNPVTHAQLGFVYLHRGEHQLAYEFFVQSFNLGAVSPEVTKELAGLLITSGNYSEAIGFLQETLRDFPDRLELVFLLGKAYCLATEHEKSITTLLKLAEEEEYKGEANKYLGLNHYALGNFPEAAEYYALVLAQRGIEIAGNVDELHKRVWSDNRG
jgi:tetratricopeptide (TPR) repeat protein